MMIGAGTTPETARREAIASGFLFMFYLIYISHQWDRIWHLSIG